MSGYDVKKLVDAGLSHFWNENYGQIYPTLDQLVRDGLATKQSAAGSGQRKRNVYTITARGKKEFRQWIEQPTDPPTVKNESQLKFFLSSGCGTRATLQLIEAQRAQQQSLLDEYRASEKVLKAAMDGAHDSEELSDLLKLAGTSPSKQARQLGLFYWTLRHGIHVTEARLVWCREVKSHFEQMQDKSD